MDKQHILNEIRRTAAENGGKPLGWRRFYAETGIKNADWLGKLWPRWGDAVKEAGFEPNSLTKAYTEAELLSMLAIFIRELGRFPVSSELRMKARTGDGFPATNTFERMGTKGEIAAKICAHLEERADWSDVLAICEPLSNSARVPRPAKETDVIGFGFVYLIRSGKRYKLGATNDLATRSKAIAVQMPDPTKTEHVIRTDDPFGIEAYWHRRFAEKRTNGEWFELDRADVAAFKRRKTM